MRLLLALFLSSALLCPGAAQASPSSVATNKALLTELKTMLDGLLIGADFATQKKIEAVSAQTEALLRKLEALEKQGITDLNRAADNIARPIAELLRSTQELVSGTQRQTFLDVATVTAALSNTVDALPATNIKPYVAAIHPNRIPSNLSNRSIKLFGYFGDADVANPVLVEIGGVTVMAVPTVGGFRFDLPARRGLTEENFVPLKIRIPRTEGALFWKKTVYDEISDHIYVYRDRPFACSYTKYLPNPDYLPRVEATTEHHENAATQGGGNRPSNNSSITAQSLLLSTVPDATSMYDTARAKILEPRCRTWGNGACEHNQWSATWNWTPDLINFSLSAPSKEPHWHNSSGFPGGYVHGGGGSHANFGCRPVFVAPRLGTNPQLAQPSESVELRRRDSELFQVSLPNDNWAIQVECEFRDGGHAFKTASVTVNPTNRAVTVSPIHAEVNEAGQLLIETQFSQATATD